MPPSNLLYKSSVQISDKISVMIPTVGQIMEDESGYYNLIHLLTAMPIDMMVPLDAANIRFTDINDYELFLMLFPGLCNMDTKYVFGDLEIGKFEPAVNKEDGKIVLLNTEDGIVIDRKIQSQIAATLRAIHHLKKNTKTPGNEAGYQYMLERAKIKASRKNKRSEPSQIESLIIALVNTEQFKYDYESVLGLSIYQFNESVRQIIHKVEVDHRLQGVYAGTVDVKGCKPEDLNWLLRKSL